MCTFMLFNMQMFFLKYRLQMCLQNVQYCIKPNTDYSEPVNFFIIHNIITQSKWVMFWVQDLWTEFYMWHLFSFGLMPHSSSYVTYKPPTSCLIFKSLVFLQNLGNKYSVKWQLRAVNILTWMIVYFCCRCS